MLARGRAARGRLQIARTKDCQLSAYRETPSGHGVGAKLVSKHTATLSITRARESEASLWSLMASNRGVKSFLTAGLPFVTFIVGGSYMLSEVCGRCAELAP